VTFQFSLYVLARIAPGADFNWPAIVLPVTCGTGVYSLCYQEERPAARSSSCLTLVGEK